MFRKLSVLGLVTTLIAITGCALLKPPVQPKEKTFEEKLIEVTQRVPGFGGMFTKFEENDYRYSLYIYLLDLSKETEIEAAIQAVFGRDFTWPLKVVQIVQGQYSLLQLWEWRDRLAEQGIIGVSKVMADVTTNRLVIWLERGEIQGSVEQELARLDIPSEAVIFTVGFTLGYPELGRQLEVPSKVRIGERVEFKLKVKNLSNHTLYLPMAAVPPYNFGVSQPDGTDVWCLAGIVTDKILCDRWSSDSSLHNYLLEPVILEPSEELFFVAEWDQRDYNGNPVPPGTYWVHAVLVIGNWWNERLKAEPKSLVIEP